VSIVGVTATETAKVIRGGIATIPTIQR
jgi:hypothetical protein